MDIIKKYAIKFGVIGILNTLVQQFLYLLFVSVNMQYLLSQTLSFVIALLFSFIMNSKFNYQVRMDFIKLMRFVAANLPSYLIQFVILKLVVDTWGGNKEIALFLTLFITVPLSFGLVSLSMLKQRPDKVI